MRQFLTKERVDALKVVRDEKYRMVGFFKPLVSAEIHILKEEGLICTQYGPGDSAKLVLTMSGRCALASVE